MDIGSVLLIFALLLIVVLFISRPILEHKAAANARDEHLTSSLMAERDRVINSLSELEFDYTLGKVPEEDYPFQRKNLLEEGAEILRRIDQSTEQVPESDAEARIEAAIAARRIATSVPGAPRNGASHGDDDIERRIASRRRERQGKSAGFCPQCGRPVQKTDRFCPSCGGALL
jgi:hypothetical protein